MSGQRYTPEFKDEAVRQVIERGYSVRDVAQRIGVSKHSLYKWVNTVKPNGDEEAADQVWEAWITHELDDAAACIAWMTIAGPSDYLLRDFSNRIHED